MSYMIEYNRQFIRSGLGYTPLWLAGSNNATQYSHTSRREIRERDWYPWMQMVGASEDELIKQAEKLGENSVECWYRKGKWIGEDGVVKWVKSGIKSAATIENIISANYGLYLGYLGCSLTVYPKDGGCKDRKTEEATSVRTTEEFDAWILRVREYVATHPGAEVYYNIEGLSIMNFVRPISCEDEKSHSPTDKVNIRVGEFYISHVDNRSMTTSRNRALAMTFTRAEATELLRKRGYAFHSHPKIVAVSDKDVNAANAVLYHKDHSSYVVGISSRHLRHCSDIKLAKHYASIASAKRAKENLVRKDPRYADSIIVMVDSSVAS